MQSPSRRRRGRKGDAGQRAGVAAGSAGATVVHVETAREMQAAVAAALPADVFIGAAAVADWRVDHVETAKIKKGGDGPPTLRMVENPDILAGVAKKTTAGRQSSIGFAAETGSRDRECESEIGAEGLRSDRRQ